MEIAFDDKDVEKLFQDFDLLARKKGIEMARVIKKRYEQLKAAETFSDYITTGLGKPHALKGNLQGLYGISVSANIRLIIEPISVDLSAKSLKKCTKVIIKGAQDYHGEKVTRYIP